MKQHSKTYEQYCWVKQKNIVLEETVFHNGTKSISCAGFEECSSCGGCKNSALNGFLNKRSPLTENNALQNMSDN